MQTEIQSQVASPEFGNIQQQKQQHFQDYLNATNEHSFVSFFYVLSFVIFSFSYYQEYF